MEAGQLSLMRQVKRPTDKTTLDAKGLEITRIKPEV
jgi:hypothetical protein